MSLLAKSRQLHQYIDTFTHLYICAFTWIRFAEVTLLIVGVDQAEPFHSLTASAPLQITRKRLPAFSNIVCWNWALVSPVTTAAPTAPAVVTL